MRRPEAARGHGWLPGGTCVRHLGLGCGRACLQVGLACSMCHTTMDAASFEWLTDWRVRASMLPSLQVKDRLEGQVSQETSK